MISSLPGSASRMFVESLGKPHNSTRVLELNIRLGFENVVELLGKTRDPTSVLEALPGKLDIKTHSPSILYFMSLFTLLLDLILHVSVINFSVMSGTGFFKQQVVTCRLRALTRQNLSLGFLKKQESNQSPQQHRLAQ